MMRISACVCLLVAVSLAHAEEPPAASVDTTSAPDRPGSADEPSSPPADCQAGETDSEAKKDTFSQRNRHSLNFIYSRGVKHFDVIEWVSRPDLLTLADLTVWQAKRDFDFDGGVAFRKRVCRPDG